MNKKIILDYLRKYNESEIIYKEYHEAKKDETRLKEFAQKYDKEEMLAKRVILPEVYPESIPPERFFNDENMFRQGCNVRIEKHDRYCPAFIHYHDFFEMVCVLRGQCRQEINGKEVCITEGDVCFIAMDVTHVIEVYDDSLVLDILIRHDTFDEIFLNSLRNKSILTTFFLNNLYKNTKADYIIFHTKGDDQIENQVLEMYMENLVEDRYSDNLRVHMVSVLFSKLLRGYEKTAYISECSLQKNDEHIQIVNYLQQNYRTATLQSTAEYFNYNPSYCSRLIKEKTGSNFVELLREIRLKHAEVLLRTTPVSIEKLAEKTGYENSETFIRVFKKSRGMTPAQYRNSKIQE